MDRGSSRPDSSQVTISMITKETLRVLDRLGRMREMPREEVEGLLRESLGVLSRIVLTNSDVEDSEVPEHDEEERKRKEEEERKKREQGGEHRPGGPGQQQPGQPGQPGQKPGGNPSR